MAYMSLTWRKSLKEAEGKDGLRKEILRTLGRSVNDADWSIEVACVHFDTSTPLLSQSSIQPRSQQREELDAVA